MRRSAPPICYKIWLNTVTTIKDMIWFKRNMTAFLVLLAHKIDAPIFTFKLILLSNQPIMHGGRQKCIVHSAHLYLSEAEVIGALNLRCGLVFTVH